MNNFYVVPMLFGFLCFLLGAFEVKSSRPNYPVLLSVSAVAAVFSHPVAAAAFGLASLEIVAGNNCRRKAASLDEHSDTFRRRGSPCGDHRISCAALAERLVHRARIRRLAGGRGHGHGQPHRFARGVSSSPRSARIRRHGRRRCQLVLAYVRRRILGRVFPHAPEVRLLRQGMPCRSACRCLPSPGRRSPKSFACLRAQTGGRLCLDGRRAACWRSIAGVALSRRLPSRLCEVPSIMLRSIGVPATAFAAPAWA